MTQALRGNERYAVGLALVTTVTWWVFASMRSALGFVLPRDLVAYGTGALALVVVAFVLKRLPARGFVFSLGLFFLYTIGQFLVRGDYGKVQLLSLIQIVFPIAFMCVGFLLWRHRRYDIALKVYVVAMALSALVGLANYFTGFAEPLFLLNNIDRAEVGSEIVQRGGSLAGGSIATGLLAGLGILISLGLPRRYWLSIPVFLLSLATTLSRGGIIAIAAGIPVLLWFSLPPPGDRRARIFRSWGAAAATILVASIVLGVGAPDKGTESNVFFARFVGDLFDTKEEGNAYRIASWNNDIEVWSESPIVGRGLGVVGTIGVMDARENGKTALAAESWYLQILAEMGVIGLGLYLLVIFGVIANGWQTITGTARGQERAVAVCIMSGFVALAIGGVFLQNLSDIIGSLFWYFVGGLLAFHLEHTSALTPHSTYADVPVQFPATPQNET